MNSLPLRSDPWTMAEFLALPEDQGYRLELVDGSVVVSPVPGLAHQRLLMSVMSAFHAATPPGLMSVHCVNVKLSEERLLIPDLVVANWPEGDALYFVAADVLLVRLLRPDGAEYREVASSSGGVLTIDRPFPLTLELAHAR